MDDEERQHWKKILEIKEKRLRASEERLAHLGWNADPSYRVEYDDLQYEIASIRAILGLHKQDIYIGRSTSKKLTSKNTTQKRWWLYNFSWSLRSIFEYLLTICREFRDTILLPLVKIQEAWVYSIWLFKKLDSTTMTWLDFKKWLRKLIPFVIALYLSVYIFNIIQEILTDRMFSVVLGLLLACFAIRLIYWFIYWVYDYIDEYL